MRCGPIPTAITLTTSTLAGCAGLQFNDGFRPDALNYYEAQPYLFVSTTRDCVSTATVVALPGAKRSVTLKSGYGSADLSVSLSSGIISSVGQKTDTKIPETIAAIGSLAAAAAPLTTEKQVVCDPTATLYPVVNGIPDLQHPLAFPISHHIIDTKPAGQ